VPNLKTSDVRVFMPAKDFATSKAFYAALGWKLTEVDERLAVLELADRRLYLQDYYAKEWAENFMIHITVEDARAWHEHVSTVLEGGRFADARAQAPRQEPYGALVTYVWDPSGVLLHFAQWNQR
jgi:predicted lactoylglutathione lyase